MGLLDKIAFWRTEAPLSQVSVEQFQQVEAAVNDVGEKTKLNATSAFNQVILLLNEIYRHLGKLRAVEQEMKAVKENMLQLVRANNALKAKALTPEIEHLEEVKDDARKAIQSNFIKLKVKLDTLQKTDKETAGKVKERLTPISVNLGKEVRLNQQIINELLP